MIYLPRHTDLTVRTGGCVRARVVSVGLFVMAPGLTDVTCVCVFMSVTRACVLISFCKYDYYNPTYVHYVTIRYGRCASGVECLLRAETTHRN